MRPFIEKINNGQEQSVNERQFKDFLNYIQNECVAGNYNVKVDVLGETFTIKKIDS